MKNFPHINQENAREILSIALSTGGTFAEVFLENSVSVSVEVVSGKTNGIIQNSTNGAALRIIKDGVEVNASVTDYSVANLKKVAAELATSFTGVVTTEVKPFVMQPSPNVVTIEKTADFEKVAVELSVRATKVAQEYSPLIIQVVCYTTARLREIGVFASDGTYAEDESSHRRFAENLVASDGAKMQSMFESYGKNQGNEMFDDFNPEEFSKEVAIEVVTMLNADEMEGGEMPVVIHNAFGGVILHEACVHSLEATSVARGMSVFCGKLGEKIASDIVTAVDTGLDPHAWGSINYDDEGTPARRNVLIEKGILKTYLVDKRNSFKMNHPITGSSRRQSYKNVTTSRMTNTYFLPGESTFEEIIKNTKHGLFAKKMGGGSVNPATGEFNFAVSEAYMIEDGKITKPVRGATLVGSGKDVLLRIDMIGDNLAFGYGMCGSLSGSIPTIVGQPTIRVSHMTVGGKGGKTE